MQISTPSAPVLDPETSAQRIFGIISAELADVEIEFERQARSTVQVIDYLGAYLRSSGGKRVRPALTILANYAVGGFAPCYSLTRMATVMEFLHTATLVHDDIIDNSEIRRNRPSVNALFGNRTAVLMGDWLYMSAFETSLAERSLTVLDILTAVTRKMTEGELLQLTLLGKTDVTEDQYFDVLQRKTAYLFGACCEIGAILAGATSSQREALRDYGLNLGAAFQLVDDLLDFTSSEEALGKAAGVDLLEGKLTLPVIFLLESEKSMRPVIESIVRDRNYDSLPRDILLQAVEESGALARARDHASKYAEVARSRLQSLPLSPYLDALVAIPTYILERDH